MGTMETSRGFSRYSVRAKAAGREWGSASCATSLLRECLSGVLDVAMVDTSTMLSNGLVVKAVPMVHKNTAPLAADTNATCFSTSTRFPERIHLTETCRNWHYVIQYQTSSTLTQFRHIEWLHVDTLSFLIRKQANPRVLVRLSVCHTVSYWYYVMTQDTYLTSLRLYE